MDEIFVGTGQRAAIMDQKHWVFGVGPKWMKEFF